ncbi:MAG: DUF4390 domain-containing protein [Lysobacterales bacterium]
MSKPLAAWLMALAAVLLPACGSGENEGRFDIDRVEANWSNGQMQVRLMQTVQLSREARTALVHGVPLTLAVELVLRDGKMGTRIRKHESSWQISYLPLSERYQLSRSDGSELRTFARLRHALAELGNVNVELETGALPQGEYELLVRGYLDKERVPPPMRLPVLFSPRWRHRSEWTAWTMNIEPGA